MLPDQALVGSMLTVYLIMKSEPYQPWETVYVGATRKLAEIWLDRIEEKDTCNYNYYKIQEWVVNTPPEYY